jgi:hypothetical protein
MAEEALRGQARRDDRRGRAAGELDRVLQRDERAERAAEHGVALEAERRVARVVREGPRLRRRGLRPALGALVDEQQAARVTERVEPRPEHRVVEAGTAVEHDQREVARPALLDVEPRVPDVHEHRATLPRRDPRLSHCEQDR